MPFYMLAGPLLALMIAVPLAWKWQLGIRRTIAIVLALAVISDVVVSVIGRFAALDSWIATGLVWMLTLGSAMGLLAYRFYRDPERTAPARDDVIVSPADGEVIYIRQSREGVLPVSNKQGQSYTLTELTKTPLHHEDAIVIGIAMNFSDVHVNRAPIAGRVALRRHFPGRFGSLRKPEMVFENERATTVIEGRSLQVAVIQIASRLVRQIASFVREGEALALGQRFGVIRLGSQVDLVVPKRDDLRITTQVGERVCAGESVLAVLESAKSEPVAYQRAYRRGTEGAIVIAEHVRGLALVRGLGRHGIPVWTLQPVGERMAAASRYSRRSIAWPGGEEAQLECLLSLAARHRLDGWALFPTGDETTAFCARHHAELSKYFRVTVPPWDVLRWAYDKRLTHQMASEIGIDQPKTVFPQSRDELSTLEFDFPVVLKPAFKREVNLFTRDKAWRADDRQTLAARYDEACMHVDRDVVMVQELIPGGGETQFSYAALCADGRCLASVTARRTRQYPVEFGHSSSYVETIDLPAIEAPARRLLAAMRHTGLAEVEFKYDRRDGRYKLLEVNPRVWTWHALCRRAGVDLPYLLWRSVHGEPVAECHGRPGARWVRMSTDIAAAAGEILRGRLSFPAYVRSLAGPLEFATFALDDPAPPFLEAPHLLASRLKRLFSSTTEPVQPTDARGRRVTASPHEA